MFVFVCVGLCCTALQEECLDPHLACVICGGIGVSVWGGVGGALWTVREGAERSGRVIRASRPGPDAMFKKQPESSI